MRLGIDMGTNSIGWWLFKQNQNQEIVKSIAAGVRIFSDGRDPKSKASLAVDRREARAMRRRRDRFLRRRAALMKKLSEVGLMPNDPSEAKGLEALDPYILRQAALDQKLALPEIGRALFHLNQRRGFKSNRKTDGRDNEGGKIKDGAARLDQAMMQAHARTYGEFLAIRRMEAKDDRAMPQTRTRMGTVESGEKESSGYDYYPTRQHLEDEFHLICEAQAVHYPELLTDDLIGEIYQVIFYQRPLKAPKIGRCLFVEGEDRLAKAHPLFQERRIYETVNALRIREAGQRDRPLSIEQRDKLVLALRDKKSVSFASLRKALKLRPDQSFSHESESRKALEGDEIRAVLGNKKCFGGRWASFDLDEKWTIIQKLRNTENPNELHEWLKENYALDDEIIEGVMNANLPEGYGRIGLSASREIVAALKAEVITYNEAVAAAGYHHSDLRTGEIFKELPYYGEILQRHIIPGSFDKNQHDPVDDAPEYWGRITNPTVHIALGQLRHLVNDIIKLYGMPDEIVVELARDLKNSEDEKRKIRKTINENRQAAIKRGEKIGELGLTDNGENRMRMRIWEGLNADPAKRLCPYCGGPIGVASLFDGSTDIDHILPYSRTLDDSIANKVVCHQSCNRQKSSKTPFEVWGHNTDRWAIISANLKNLPKGAQWRFGPDAMERFEGEKHFEKRQLSDTQYLARITREYLSFLYPEKGHAPVWAVPGRLTEMLRRHWGLNEILSDAEDHDVMKKKNRQDHRHHAIDAAVIASTDRGLVQRISKASSKNENEGRDAVASVDPPYDEFCDDIIETVRGITVSHRADHGTVKANDPSQTSAQLHNDTAYGLTGQKTASGIDVVVYRKALNNLTDKDIYKIRDPDLQAALYSVTHGLSGKEFKAALAKFAESDVTYRGIRRVRLISHLGVIPINDKAGKVYKGYKGDSNHCAEVWRLPDGSWESRVLTTFEAHKNGLGSTRPHPAAKLIMRLHKDDAVALEHPKAEGNPWIIAVVSSTELKLFQPEQANVDARNRNKEIDFNYLRIGLGTFQKYKLRKVGIDRLGRVRDPGFE